MAAALGEIGLFQAGRVGQKFAGCRQRGDEAGRQLRLVPAIAGAGQRFEQGQAAGIRAIDGDRVQREQR